MLVSMLEVGSQKFLMTLPRSASIFARSFCGSPWTLVRGSPFVLHADMIDPSKHGGVCQYSFSPYPTLRLRIYLLSETHIEVMLDAVAPSSDLVPDAFSMAFIESLNEVRTVCH